MKYVFVTGLGRSGTTFTSLLLACAPEMQAQHEYIGDREYWLLSWYLESHDYAVPYLKRARIQIDEKFGGKTEYFVDVNGYLRNSVPHLKAVFDDAPVFHLVRDPRKVIPSICVRRNDRSIDEIPKDRSEIERWLDYDKFSQVCWNWGNTTRRLLEQDTILLQFERLVSDYNYVRNRVIDPLGVHLTRAEWDRLRTKKVNKTRSKFYRYLYAKARGKPFINEDKIPFEEWTQEQRAVYEETCGEIARQLGYE